MVRQLKVEEQEYMYYGVFSMIISRLWNDIPIKEQTKILNDSKKKEQEEFAQAFNIPNKITVEEYQKMGLDLNRGRTWEYKGFVYLSCYECKEGWCFDKDIVIEGTYGCGCWGCEVD